jgi:hypothetical protein
MTQETRDLIGKEMTDKATASLAVELKKKWAMIGSLLSVKTGDYAPIDLPAEAPSKQEMESVSRQLIENGEAEFILRDGTKQSVSLREIDGRLNNLKASGMLDEQQLQSLESIGSVQALVPSKTTISKIAEAADEGIESKSGMGGIGSFIAAIFTFLASLVGSFFGQGPAISWGDALAQHAAPNVSQAANERLDALAANDTAAARLLGRKDENGRTTQDSIVAGIDRAARQKLGATELPPETTAATPSYEDTPVERAGMLTRSQLAETVRDRVAFPTDKNGKKILLATQIEDRLNASITTSEDRTTRWLGTWALDVPEASKKMADVIADTTHGIVGDPHFTFDGKKLTAMTKEERANAIAETVGDQLLKREKEFGFNMPVTGTFGYKTRPAWPRPMKRPGCRIWTRSRRRSAPASCKAMTRSPPAWRWSNATSNQYLARRSGKQPKQLLLNCAATAMGPMHLRKITSARR